MLTFVLILLVTLLALAGLLYAWSFWFQGYIYSEPAEKLWWRAPAAAGALTLFFGLWAALDCWSRGHYHALHELTTYEGARFDDLTVVYKDGKEETFTRPKAVAEGRPEYVHNGKPMRERPEKIVVEENGRKTTFNPDRDAKGNFTPPPQSGFLGLPVPGMPKESRIYYRDDRGRVMVEDELGEVSLFRWDWLVMNLFLNFLHPAVWFVCLWLLLRFQWPHALGQALVAWGVFTIFIIPPFLAQAELAAHVVK